jgi:hypothetical protein
MSTYDWECGTIKLPSKIYVRFRNDFIKAHNKVRQDLFILAIKAWEALKANRLTTARAVRKSKHFNLRDAISAFVTSDVDEAMEVEEMLHMAYRIAHPQGDWKLRKPTMKVAGFAKMNARSFDVGGEACISFNDKAKSVTWDVAENNHAVDHAHKQTMGRYLFRALNKVEWTRGTGGTIVGNDEYNRESDYEGGGANYITYRYGPKKKGNVLRMA